MDRCRSLLEPLADKLGESEGARILGEIYAREGKVEESFKLLNQYVTTRLPRLHAAR
jgi:hypothetical protein